MLSYFVTPYYWVSSVFVKTNINFAGVTILTLSYSLGFVIYGLSLIKEKVINWISFLGSRKKVLRQISKSETFLAAKKIAQKESEQRGVDLNIIEGKEEEIVKELRSFVMSCYSDSDQKTYTFMFRAELSNHLNTLCLLFGLIGLILCVCGIDAEHSIFQITTPYITLYTTLLLMSILLFHTDVKFYERAMKLPFSIYLARTKITRDKNNEDKSIFSWWFRK